MSGSSSLEIQAKISESLAGRKKLFQMRSFSFGEFITTKWNDFPAVAKKLTLGDRGSLLASLGQIQRLYQTSLEKWFAEHLTYGGYPRVILEANVQRKLAQLKEVFTSYLQKDVKDFFKIENVAGYNNLIKVLSQQIGNLVNISNLSNILGLSQTTVEKYLQVLEGTFMFKRLTPFFQNVRRELSKMPKIYALDLGMRNFAAGNFNDVLLRGDRGEMAENFVFTELERLIEAPNELHFWRTQTKAEVDFIIALPSGPIPVEVKFTTMKAPELTRSFNSFLSTYQPDLGVVFTKDFLGRTQVGRTEILFLPLWSLLFLKLEHLLKA
jgi:predicted AAA+ superfamily ATPase